MATVNPRVDSVRRKTDFRASVVPEITTVSNPNSSPPRAATIALPIRVPVRDAGAGGAAVTGRVFLRDSRAGLRFGGDRELQGVGQGGRAAGPRADERRDLVGVAVDLVERAARRAGRRPGPR